MKRKSGFTLAEVLISLGVIGVVAALTIPVIASNVQKSQVGPGVGKAIRALVDANRVYMTQSGATDIVDNCGDDYIKCLVDDNALNALPLSRPSWYNYDGTSYSNSSTISAYKTRDGIIYWASAAKNDATSQTNYYDVIVDINGSRKPNRFANDTFVLTVLSQGDVVAYGSQAWYNALSTTVTQSKYWKDNCNTTVATDWECAGSVVDNNYTVIYPFK